MTIRLRIEIDLTTLAALMGRASGDADRYERADKCPTRHPQDGRMRGETSKLTVLQYAKKVIQQQP